MQRQYGFAPLGAADGPTKNAIFGANNARLYNYSASQRADLVTDKLALAKAKYVASGTSRSNLAYGYIRKDDLTTASQLIRFKAVS